MSQNHLRRAVQHAKQQINPNIDLRGRPYTIGDAKKPQQLTLPLPDFVYHLLENRKATAGSEYVFAENGKARHLIEPHNQVQKVIDASGVSFTLHDLRLSYITIAESIDISASIFTTAAER